MKKSPNLIILLEELLAAYTWSIEANAMRTALLLLPGSLPAYTLLMEKDRNTKRDEFVEELTSFKAILEEER